MVKAYEATSGRSSFLKLSKVPLVPKEEQTKYLQADASCLIFSNSVCPDAKHIPPVMSEVHIAWQRGQMFDDQMYDLNA